MRKHLVNITKAITQLESIAPLGLAQTWDNVGLLLGDPDGPLQRILLTVDVTAAVVAEAQKLKADLIVCYHPLIWEPLKRITRNGPEAKVHTLIQNNIAVYCVHTALDVAPGGVNDGLAEALGIAAPEPIGDYVDDPEGPHYKLVTFVPQEYVAAVSEALFQAGAGRIGHYSHCGFQTEGTGTFLPLDGAHPAIGQTGRHEAVAEIKLESVVHARYMPAVLAALRHAHPYETPAFDVFRHHDMEQRLGLGRMGALTRPAPLSTLLDRLQKRTGARTMGFIGPQRRRVKTAAVCAGSCGSMIQKVIDRGCDLYVTGELKHHLALVAAEAGLTCVCLSHSVSERFILKKIAKQLQKGLPGVTIRLSTRDKDPFNWKTL